MDLAYDIACRTCFKQYAMKLYTPLKDIEGGYAKKTEYEVVLKLENIAKAICPFCKSSNIEYLNLGINGMPLYDFDRIAARCHRKKEFMVMLNFDKTGSNISVTPGGSKSLNNTFMTPALHLIVKTIIEKPDLCFEQHIKGNSFICISEDFDREHEYIKVERFRTAGLTRKELFNAIRPIATQMGIRINIDY
jgi:hypothetical protein